MHQRRELIIVIVLAGVVPDLIGDAADTSRAEWLEIAVIVLIAVEIVAALR